MGEKTVLPRKKKRFIIALIICIVVLAILVIVMKILSNRINAGDMINPDIRRLADIRILVIFLMAIDGIMLFQFLIFAFYRADQ